jgi:heme-degrading monooxygenase HmoA
VRSFVDLRQSRSTVPYYHGVRGAWACGRADRLALCRRLGDRLNTTPEAEKGALRIVELREMDERTTYVQQLGEDSGPVVLMNQFNVAPEDVEQFVEVWTDDAGFMKSQPGFISTQLHRGIAGSTTFMNVAVWESASALGNAFRSPEFQQRAARYPESAVAAPHVFEKVAVPGICVA